MTNSRSVLFAILASVLLITAVPADVAAASNQLATASVHTTESDFNGATTLDNVSVDPSGFVALDSGSGTTTVDSFEDQDISEYSGNTGFTTVTTWSSDGSYALEVTTDNSEIFSDDGAGLAAYPEPGDTFSLEVRGTQSDSNIQTFFGGTSATNNYMVSVDLQADEFKLFRQDSGSFTELAVTTVSISASTEYTLEVDWQSDGQMTATLLDSSGNTLDSISATDTNYTTGGIGFRGFRGAQWDYVRLGSQQPETGTYVSQTHAASQVEAGSVNLSLTNASATVTWLADTDGDGTFETEVNSSTYTSTGNYTLDLSGSTSEAWRVNVTFDKTGANPTAQVYDERVLFDPAAPSGTLKSPAEGAELTESSVDFSIDVTDPDFGTAQGDEVTATLQLKGPDDSSYSDAGSNTVTSNGTVNVSASPSTGGVYQYRWVLEDSYGESTTTASRNVSVPAELRIYSETEPTELINSNISLRVRFYGLESDQVITREVDNGTVDLSGLPVNERFVVTVRDNQTDRFTYRRVIVDSLYETSRIYLLNKSNPNSQVVFRLEDPTGEFPPEETILYIEKPITINNTTTYQTIAGDTFGATAQFPVILQQDERYRLRVETEDGSSSRILGAYSVYTDAVTEPLQIQRIEPRADADSGSSVYGGLTYVDGQPYLAVRYLDPQNETTSVEYRVVTGDGTEIVANTTRTTQEFADLYSLTNVTNATTYRVEYTIERGGNVTTGVMMAGQIPGVADRFAIDGQVLSIVSWVAVLSTMGLLVIVDTKLAPIGGTGMATALTMLGTVAIPMPLLGVAGVVSVFTLVGGSR